jgi:ribosomal protein S18 acetylase RimI-like enzyme
VATISSGGHGDISGVLALWRRATTEPSETDDVLGLEALLAHAPNALILASEEGTIVGSVIASWDGWRGAMYRLAVLPSRRRRGIASALGTEGERRLLARGVRRVHMIVAADQAAARDFWEFAGYADSGQARFVKDLA